MDIPVFVPILAGIMISIIFITTAYLENKKRNSNNSNKENDKKTLEEEMEQHRKYVEYVNKKVYNIIYVNNKTKKVIRNFVLKRNQLAGGLLFPLMSQKSVLK